MANRDLKLENLLLDHDGTSRPLLKICDFGYSKVLHNQPRGGWAGCWVLHAGWHSGTRSPV